MVRGGYRRGAVLAVVEWFHGFAPCLPGAWSTQWVTGMRKIKANIWTGACEFRLTLGPLHNPVAHL
jgi:hypothetical protein